MVQYVLTCQVAPIYYPIYYSVPSIKPAVDGHNAVAPLMHVSPCPA